MSKRATETNLGRKAKKLIKGTPWAFTREGLAAALKTRTPSLEVRMGSVDAILNDLLEAGTIKRVNGNGYKGVYTDVTPETVKSLLQLNAIPVHESFLYGHFGTTEPRRKKLAHVLEQLRQDTDVLTDKKFFSVSRPMANSSHIRLSRNNKYANMLNWVDTTIPPYIKLPPGLSSSIENLLSENGRKKRTAIARFGRTASISLTVKEILPPSGIVSEFCHSANGTGYLRPIDYRHSGTFTVDPENSAVRPKRGDRLLARHKQASSLSGTPMQIIGLSPEDNTYSSIDLFGRSCAIPEAVEEEVRGLLSLSQANLPITRSKKFRTLTQKPFFTVDPRNRQDIDDALCFEANPDGSITAYVAIANVVSQIPFGSKIDKLRRERPMAIFLANGAHHTMPHELYNAKNGYLSLCEGQTRHALIHEFRIPQYLDSLSEIEMDVYPALIRSRRAFSYSEFGESLANPEKLDQPELVQNMDISVRFVNSLHMLLGSLPFDSRKLRLLFNEVGEVESYSYRPPEIADQVIELAALLTNIKSAERIMTHNDTYPDKAVPLIFRNQDMPHKEDIFEALERIEKIVPGLSREWMVAALRDTPIHEDSEYSDIARDLIRNILRDCPNEAKRSYISKLLLQATHRAYYSTREGIHFSLDAKTGHFTSPLRRYVDTINQRSLMAASDIPVPPIDLSKQELDQLARFSSDEEENAAQIQSHSTQRYLIDFFRNTADEPIANADIAHVREDGVVISIEGIDGFISRTHLPCSWKLEPCTQNVRVLDAGNMRSLGIGDRLPLPLDMQEADPLTRSLKFQEAAYKIKGKISSAQDRAFA